MNYLCFDLTDKVITFVTIRKLFSLINKRKQFITKFCVDFKQYIRLVKKQNIWFIPKSITNINEVCCLFELNEKFLYFVIKYIDINIYHQINFFLNCKNLRLLKFIYRNNILTKQQFYEIFKNEEFVDYKLIKLFHKHMDFPKDFFIKLFASKCFDVNVNIIFP